MLVPGVTGWAQINGRNNVSIEEKVEIEKEYITKKGFLFDIYILIMTIRKFVLRESVTYWDVIIFSCVHIFRTE